LVNEKPGYELDLESPEEGVYQGLTEWKKDSILVLISIKGPINRQIIIESYNDEVKKND
jgi:hypothetical protein